MRRLALLLMAGASTLHAQRVMPPALVPQPASMTVGKGAFELSRKTTLWASPNFAKVAETFATDLRAGTGLPLPITKRARATTTIRLQQDASVKGSEAYRLDVTPTGVTVRASAPAGAFYGLVTLQQLFPIALFSAQPDSMRIWRAPAVRISDAPRFSWRGAHLDVSRHFFSVSDVKHYIDALARHKLNRFHWHLTDDQGWRLEIRKYPKLTEVGGCRAQTMVGIYQADPAKRNFDKTKYCGFYTQDEVREVVAFAAERFVTIVPEIEMPGHAQAAVSAYPELGLRPDSTITAMEIWGVSPYLFNAEESTIGVLQDVLTEVMELFPSPWIHVGGDEADKTLWKTSPAIKERIQTLGLKDEHALQSWFISQMDGFLTKHGRRLIGWDEILEGGLAENATVMSWRGVQGGIAAARSGHDVVMTPTSHTYFDYYQSKDTDHEPLAIGGYLPLEKVYDFEPVPKGLTPAQAKHVLGTQGQIWTEYLPNRLAVEYMAFPRLAALAEVAWTPASRRNYADFKSRLTVHVGRLDGLGIRYRPLDP